MKGLGNVIGKGWAGRGFVACRGRTTREFFVVNSRKFQEANQVVDIAANRVCGPGEGMRGVELIF